MGNVAKKHMEILERTSCRSLESFHGLVKGEGYWCIEFSMIINSIPSSRRECSDFFYFWNWIILSTSVKRFCLLFLFNYFSVGTQNGDFLCPIHPGYSLSRHSAKMVWSVPMAVGLLNLMKLLLMGHNAKLFFAFEDCFESFLMRRKWVQLSFTLGAGMPFEIYQPNQLKEWNNGSRGLIWEWFFVIP